MEANVPSSSPTTTMPDPAFIGRSFDQICFVVPDLAAAVDDWRRINGIMTWDIVEDLALHQSDKEYWGQPGNFQFSCAYGMAGSTLIELARHDEGDSIYAGWTGGLHHVGFQLANVDEFTTATRWYEAQGLVRAMGGHASGPKGGCRWVYYDTRATMGCFTELYVLEGDAVAQFAEFKAGRSDRMIL